MTAECDHGNTEPCEGCEIERQWHGHNPINPVAYTVVMDRPAVYLRRAVAGESFTIKVASSAMQRKCYETLKRTQARLTLGERQSIHISSEATSGVTIRPKLVS